MDFTWADPYPDLQKICTLFSRTDLVNPLKWHYTPLPSYLQNGPQCGLVALAILMDQPSKELVDRIFKHAQSMGISYNGEIFSTSFMYSLAKEFIKDKGIEIYNGNLQSQKIVDALLNKGKLLVPYDTNKDNSPGLHGGHKAHWCVASGVVQTQDDSFVIARHGKAKNVAIWNLRDLAQNGLHNCSPPSPDEVKINLEEGDHCISNKVVGQSCAVSSWIFPEGVILSVSNVPFPKIPLSAFAVRASNNGFIGENRTLKGCLFLVKNTDIASLLLKLHSN